MEAICEYCGTPFEAKSKRHRYCSDKCRSTHARDIKYFAGKRRYAVGISEMECWICTRQKVKRSPVHHVAGVKNLDEPQVVLCPGCHKIVELLSQRRFLSNAKSVADLITLARFKALLPDAKTVVRYQIN